MDETFELRIRPLQRSDEEVLQAVFSGLSDRSRYLRFHSPTPRLTGRIRRALLDVDGRQRLALVAEVCHTGCPDRWEPIGIARLAVTGQGEAEVAIEVTDAWQRRGVARRLLGALRARAGELGLGVLYALVLPENRAALAAFAAVFPIALRQWDGDAVRLVLPLAADGPWVAGLDGLLADALR